MTLERLINEFRKPESIADTIASVTYGIGYGLIAELMIAHMDAWKFAKARTTMSIVNFVTGHPYGMFLDWAYRKTGTTKESHLLRRTPVDAAAMITFYGPIYAGVIALSGGDKEQIKSAMEGMLALSWLVPPTYSWYMRRLRGAFGAEAVQQDKLEERE